MPIPHSSCRRRFLLAWCLVLSCKLLLAAHVPLFVDEAFYWQESRHPAWAYSDLPGLTAWLAGIGPRLFGQHAWALRLPFVVMAAAVPWIVVMMTRRHAGADAGWRAGIWALLLPLAGTLGLLGLPDVAMALASVLCLDAGARLLHRVDALAAAELAAGLVMGGLSHYRFAAVIGIGGLVLLALPQGRRALADWRVWLAIATGAAAWLPLLLWNLQHGDAGLRFQLVDRHPWTFHAEGSWFVVIQMLLVTPLLFAALLLAAWQHRASADAAQRHFAWNGGLLILAFFVLGFFADNERVSFHWPLPGYLALLPLLPAVLDGWRPAWRRAAAAVAAFGLLAAFGYFLAVSVPALRARLAAHKGYPSNFAGWDRLADAVRARQSQLPPGTRLLADNFKIGAELGFLLDDPGIAVLDHPLNHHHGRAPQLALWGLQWSLPADAAQPPLLLVLGATDVQYRDLLARYHAVCRQLGPLPPPQVLNVDHGRQRFLLFSVPQRSAAERAQPCAAPAMGWIDLPVAKASVGQRFTVQGWAFKDGVGLDRIQILLDGQPIADAVYGLPSPGTAAYWKISNDPNHPDVGFQAQVQLPEATADGMRWLGLRLHGRDGSVEDWAEQPLRIEAGVPNR